MDGKTGDPEYPTIPIRFDENGFVKDAYLTILNLRPDSKWEKVTIFIKSLKHLNLLYVQLTVHTTDWPIRKRRCNYQRYYMARWCAEASPRRSRKI